MIFLVEDSREHHLAVRRHLYRDTGATAIGHFVTVISIATTAATSLVCLPPPPTLILPPCRFPRWRYQPPLDLLGEPAPRLPSPRPSVRPVGAPWLAALRSYQGRRA